jgi:hypothetical protein
MKSARSLQSRPTVAHADSISVRKCPVISGCQRLVSTFLCSNSPLILSRNLFRMIHDNNFHRTLSLFQFEPELLLHGGE